MKSKVYTTSEKAHGVREVQGPVQYWRMKSKDERKADNASEKREIKLSLISRLAPAYWR